MIRATLWAVRSVIQRSMKHVFESAFELPLPLPVVFEFFSTAHNLEKITPPEMGFQLITPKPIEMKVGTEIDYRLRIAGIPVRWRSLISRWEPPYAFTDEQLRGPYASWVHSHTFAETAGGSTVRDSVAYELPLAPFGEIAHFFVRGELKKIFAFREKSIREALLPGRV